MHVSWHLNYLRPHPIHTHTQTLSQRRLYHINTHTLSPRREHINSTHNTGWGAWGKRSCLSLNTRCRTCCSLGCHAPIVILSHWLSAHWNVQHWRQNLFPAGLTDWVKFGAMNHHSTKLCMTVLSMGTFDLEAEIYSKGLFANEVYNDGSLPVWHPSVNILLLQVREPPGSPSLYLKIQDWLTLAATLMHLFLLCQCCRAKQEAHIDGKPFFQLRPIRVNPCR